MTDKLTKYKLLTLLLTLLITSAVNYSHAQPASSLAPMESLRTGIATDIGTLDFDQGIDMSNILQNLEQTERSLPVPEIQQAVPVPANIKHPGPVIGEPLDPVFIEWGEDLRAASKAEWQRRLKANKGRAVIAPLDSIDPSKKLVVYIPGIGLTFQDAYALARLNDKYQFVIAIYNQRYTLDNHGEQMAEALEKLMQYRLELAEARGIKTDRELCLIGHSYGGLVGQLVLAELVKKGLVHNGPDSLFPRILYFCIDAGWRGFDAPWVFTLPGIKHVMGEIMPKIPLPKKATHSALTVLNHTNSMNRVLKIRLPENITVRMVNVPPEGRQKIIEPVNGWYSYELGKGELQQIWEYLKSPSTDGNRLNSWNWGILIRKQGLQQLWRTLERDSDFRTYEAELYESAVQSKTLEEFKVRYDEIISRIVDTFHGQHTRFMWEDPSFMPWLRNALAEWEKRGQSHF